MAAPPSVVAQVDDNQDESAAAIYARAYNVTLEVAQERLAIQHEIPNLIAKIEEAEPTYAGSWISHTPDFLLFVGFTAADGAAIVQSYLTDIEWAAIVKTQQMPHTVSELLDIQRKVDGTRAEIATDFSSATDFQKGKVVLYTTAPDALRQELATKASLQPYLDDIEVLLQEEPLAPADDQDESAAAIYAKAFNVTLEVAQERLAIQHEIPDLITKIEDAEPTYAGSWISHEPDYVLFVGFTAADGEAILEKYLTDIKWAAIVRAQQMPHTIGELLDIQRKVDGTRAEIATDFASATAFQKGKIVLYAAKPDVLRQELESKASLQPYLDEIEVLLQAEPPAPGALKYPYLLGGTALSLCTAGFVVKRTSDQRRFIATAGHCVNAQYLQDANGIYFGPVVAGSENNPIQTPPVGNPTVDFQAHDTGVRAFDLTNVIRTNTNTTAVVTTYQYKASTQGKMVCKYGKSTGKTCGTVFSTNYTPGTPYDPGATGYVQVINALQGEMGCPGDSGSPVFEETGGTVSGVGIYSGQQGDSCDGIGWFFFYSSVNALDTTGYKILTTHYTQYKYQTVWRSATDCKEYYRMMDENGNAVGPNVEQTCPNSTLPPGSSGEIYSYTAYITGNQLRESMWRGNTGYTRLTPLNNNGTVNWPATNGWLWCCNGTPPQAQGAFVVGNQYNQTVYGSTTDCKRYSRALNNAGQPSGATTVVNCTGQFVPPGLAAGAQMKTYTAFAIAGTLREELWIDGKGYLRNVPLTADNKAVNWNSAPAWNHCCDGAAPLGQGAYIVSRP